MPTSTEEAQSVTYTECSASQESPFLAPKPLVILDKICISKHRVEGEEGNGVEIIVPRQPNMQTGTLNICRCHGNRGPASCQSRTHSQATKAYIIELNTAGAAAAVEYSLGSGFLRGGGFVDVNPS